MRFCVVLVLLYLLSACTLLFDSKIQTEDSDGGAECEEVGLDEFVNINLVDIDVDDPSVSASGLELYFNRDNAIWLATREQACGPWENPASLGIGGGLTNMSNLNLEPSGEVLHFTNDSRPYTLTRDSPFGTWPVNAVDNLDLLERVQAYYTGNIAPDDVKILDVFRPSAETEVLLVGTDIPASRNMLRVDVADIADLGLADAGAQEVWATADESTVFAGTGGRIVRSTRQSRGQYNPSEVVQDPGHDPWVYSRGDRDFLYFTKTVSTGIRHLSVIELE